ncbi:hypothetical protein PQX77_012956 [Marasmius sp. AFHP31]|nr:hypothetical protein PQX77_012956 [Marasmius sp. AFHP31]
MPLHEQYETLWDAPDVPSQEWDPSPSPKRRRVEVEEVEDDEGDNTQELCPEKFVSVDFEGAGAAVQGSGHLETDFERQRRERTARREEMWSPFASREEWELARWLMLSGVSQGKIDEFCSLSIIRDRVQPSFKNKRTFLKKIDELPKVRGGWHCEELEVVGNIMEVGDDGVKRPKTEAVELWMRDPVECIRELLQDSRFKDHVHYAPEKVYTNLSMKMRAIDEMWTADWWWSTQKLLPKGATIAPVILASDKTQLSTFSGDKSAWPVYMTIGNLRATVRRKPSEHASILVGYIPVSKLECFSPDVRSGEGYRLFHDCMRRLLKPLAEAGQPTSGGSEMLCSDGRVRVVYPLLAAYVADFPEQCLVAGCQERRCPKCLSTRETLGDPVHSVLRDPEKTVKALKDAANGNKETAQKWGLREITPFWMDLPLCNIFHCFTPDILHQLHKGVFKDHVAKWSVESLPHSSNTASKAEVDARFKSMPRHSELRHFKKGISLVVQWTGNEYKHMEKVFLGVLSGTAPREVVVCVRAVLDFIHYAQLEIHTDGSLEKMDTALRTFHDHKEAAFTTREHFNIPKIHSMQHYVPTIQSHGVATGYNTEWSERLHIDFTKLAYRASNRKEFIKQMAKWLDRRESIQYFSRFLSWSLDEGVASPEESEDDSNVEKEGGDDENSDSESEENDDVNGEEASTPDINGPCGNQHASCSYAKRPPLSLDISALESSYGCERFVYALEKFLVERNMRRHDYWDTRPGHYQVYKQFKLSLPPIPEVSYEWSIDTVHATPSYKRNGKSIASRFDTVLAREKIGDDCTVGLKGTLMASIVH